MGRHAPNPRLIKIHRSYTVEEAARVLGVHKQTVRNWLKQGLAAIDDRRPTVILGSTLREFLERRRAKAKRACPPGHFYCLRCRAPKPPALGMVDYVPFSATIGNLQGICPDCDAIINRRVALAKIAAVRANLEITFRQAHPRLGESDVFSLDCNFKGAG